MGKQRKQDATAVVDDKPEKFDVGDVVDKRTGNPDPFPKDVIKGSDLFDVEPADSDEIGVKNDTDEPQTAVADTNTSQATVSDAQEGPIDIFDTVNIPDDDQQTQEPQDKTAEMLEMLRQRDEYIKQLAEALTKLQPEKKQPQGAPSVDEAIFDGILDPDVRERVKRQYMKQQETLKKLEADLAALKNIAMQTSMQQQVEKAKSYVYGLTKQLVNKEGIIPELQVSIKRMIDGALYAFANGMPEAQTIFRSEKELHNWIKTVVSEHKKLQDQVKARLAGGIKTREEAPAIGGGGTSKAKEKPLPKSFDEARRYLAEQLRELNEQQ